MEQSEFNTYKDGLNLRFLRDYCQEHGTVRKMMRGETLEETGEPARSCSHLSIYPRFLTAIILIVVSGARMWRR